ncbi:MAG: PQQ-binding-like beta-propeller repeat protein, partial [Holophagales bacterium]|nr:PQQ-binding-like beta-propeller repeat protein [Holophagales bacterium]
MRRLVSTVLFASLLFLLACSAWAEGWPHWRGPQHDGSSTATGLPTTWSWSAEDSTNVRWRHDLPGAAGSSPVVWGDRIFVTSTENDGEGLRVLAISRKGERLWSAEAGQGTNEVFEQFAHETNAAAPSPVTDGEHVWALFSTAELHAFRTEDGKRVWKADLAERYGAPELYFGLSTSPLLLDGRLYLQLLHAEAQLVLALDAATGEEVWKHERSTDATDECLHAYTSVIPFRPGGDGATQLLVHGADYLSAHRTDDGAELWRYGSVNPKEGYNPMFRLVSTPVVHGGLIVAPTAKRGPVFGLRPGTGKGRIGPGDDR